MAYRKLPDLFTALVDANGDPASGHTLYFYVYNTSTPASLYTDSAGTALGTSCTLNSLGRPQTGGGTACELFGVTTQTAGYKIVQKDSLGATVQTFAGPIFCVPNSRSDLYYSASDAGALRLVDAAAMILDTALAVGDFVITTGYNDAGDGGDNIYQIVAAATGTADGGAFINLSNGLQAKGLFPGGKIIVNQWGAIPGSSSTTQQVAVQACVDYVIDRGDERNSIYFGAGIYELDDEIDIFRASSTGIDIDFYGEGMGATEISSDFYGADKYLFKALDPLATDRCAPTTFSDMQIGTVSRSGGVNPILLGIIGFGEGFLNNVKFGPSNNTHLTLGSMQNIRGTNIQSRSGGKSYTYKDTDALTFTVTGSAGTTATLTASAPIFTDGTAGTTDDVGLSFLTIPSNGANRIKWTISAYTSTTVVTVTCDDPANTAAATGYFQSAFGSMSSGSNQLSVNSNVACFAAEDVGRIIYVKEARSGTSSSKSILRARIGTFVSSSAVTLEDEYGTAINADRNVTNVEFATPSVDFYTPENGSAGLIAGSTDNKFNFLHIEDPVGLPLGITNMQQFEIQTSKIEGRLDVASDAHTTASMWLDDVRGEIDCDISTHTGLNKVRVYIANQTGSLLFPNNDIRNFVGGSSDVIFKAEAMTDPDGEVLISNPVFLYSYDDISDAFIDDTAIADPTDPRVFVTGHVRAGTNRYLFNGPLTPTYNELSERSVDILADTNNTLNIGSLAKRFAQLFVGIISFGSSGTVTDRNGSGSPEGVVTATKGSTYRRVDGGAGTCFYVKESDSTNTGWVAK